MRATARANGSENRLNQNGAWVSARCSSMLRIASPWSISTSRSGRVPATPPHGGYAYRSTQCDL